MLLDNLLTKQGLSPRSEIIVVCSGCTDRTEDIVKTFCNRDHRVKLILEEERRGKISAVNTLLKHACNEIMVLPAADTLPAEGAIKKIVSPFYDKKVGVAGGRPIPIDDQLTPAGFIVHFIWLLHHKISLYENASEKLWHPSGELWAIRTQFVKALPQNIVNDDAYIGLMAKRSGFKVVYVPEAVTYIKGPGNLYDLLRQRRRIAVGHLQIKKETGITVSTANSRTLLPTLIRVFLDHSSLKMNLTRFPGIILSVALESIAHLLAVYDLLKNNVPYKWNRIASTKNLLSRANV